MESEQEKYNWLNLVFFTCQCGQMIGDSVLKVFNMKTREEKLKFLEELKSDVCCLLLSNVFQGFRKSDDYQKCAKSPPNDQLLRENYKQKQNTIESNQEIKETVRSLFFG